MRVINLLDSDSERRARWTSELQDTGLLTIPYMIVNRGRVVVVLFVQAM